MSKNINYQTVNTDKTYAEFTPCGKKVLLKKLVKKIDKKYGDIFLPHSTAKNQSLGIATIVEIGDDAELQQIGLSVGDIILYDYYSVYNDNPVYVVTNYENILLKITQEEADFILNNYIIYG